MMLRSDPRHLPSVSLNACPPIPTYRVDGYIGGMLPPSLPVNIGHYEDSFAKTDGRWLLARRITVLPFGSETRRLLTST
jgi:hypothetical protein